MLYGFSREGKVAAYGNEAIYKVYTVMVVPPLKKDPSREQNSQSGSKKQNSENRSFEKLLDSEQEKVRDKDVLVTASGYSKDLKPVAMFYKTREYV